MKFCSAESIFIALTCLFLTIGCASHSLKESTITTQEFDSTITLTVPASNIKMSIPKLELVKQDSNHSESNRYFYYWDTNTQIGISGWFEPEALFEGTQHHWRQFVDTWDGNQPTNIKFEKLNGWEVVRYDIVVQNCTQSNAKAFLVQSETWIEIHVSSFCRIGEYNADVMDYIRHISVQSKE